MRRRSGPDTHAGASPSSLDYSSSSTSPSSSCCSTTRPLPLIARARPSAIRTCSNSLARVFTTPSAIQQRTCAAVHLSPASLSPSLSPLIGLAALPAAPVVSRHRLDMLYRPGRARCHGRQLQKTARQTAGLRRGSRRDPSQRMRSRVLHEA